MCSSGQRSEGVRRAIFVACLALGLLVGLAGNPGVAGAKVFAGRKDALREAFPAADRIEEKTHILTQDLADAAEQRSHARLETRLITIYTAHGPDGVLGYAHISIHNVRTKPEALLIVLTAEGQVRSVRMLAFHEPLDYLPAGRWYDQFEGRSRTEPLRVGHDVHAVVGSTLSARAASDAVRQTLVFYELLIQPESED